MKKHDDADKKKEEDISSLPEKIDQVQDLEDRVEEWKNKYLRALADYQNLEKRTDQEKKEIRTFAAEVTLRKFLPAIDSLTRATKHIDDPGLHLALKEFHAALESCGVKRIEVVGKSFDPFVMECVEVVDAPSDAVIEEVTAGFMFYDKLLRVAQVKVGKKS